MLVKDLFLVSEIAWLHIQMSKYKDVFLFPKTITDKTHSKLGFQFQILYTFCHIMVGNLF